MSATFAFYIFLPSVLSFVFPSINLLPHHSQYSMDFVPKQNYDPIVYAGNGGFSGSTSNLRYYDYALSVFEINSVVYFGPNLSAANGTTASSYFDYLGQSWYSGI